MKPNPTASFIKTILFISLIVVCSLGKLSAQTDYNPNISIEFNNVSLQTVLNSLEQDYALNFSYSNDVIPLQKKVSIHQKEQSLKTVLNLLFENTGIQYRFIGNQIVLAYRPKTIAKSSTKKIPTPKTIQEEKETVIEATPIVITQQVKGSVKNKQTQSLLSGVQVELLQNNANTNLQTITDAYGNFAFYAVPVGRYDLLFHQIGYEDMVLVDVSVQTGTVMPLQIEMSAIATNNQRTVSAANLDTDMEAFKPNPVTPKFEQEQEISTRQRRLPRTFAINEEGYQERPFSFSVIPPISSNGIKSGDFVNNVSLGLFVNYSAGLKGIEVSGFANVEKDYVEGIQVASFANLVQHKVQGIQASGFLNANGYSDGAIQVAGFANLTRDTSKAIQAAGFANVVGGSLTGWQGSGFTNIANGSLKGGQISGFYNGAKGNMDGLQIGGFANSANEKASGLQIAGFGNYAKEMDGIQASGFINYAEKVKGLQIGVVNYCDTIDGIPIGLISYVEKGYKAFEINTSETLLTNFAFKTGVRQFYNIISLGYLPANRSTFGEHSWSYGYGIGTQRLIKNNWQLGLELSTHQINEDRLFSNRLNLLNQLKADIGIPLGGGMVLGLGANYNVLVSDLYNSETQRFGSDLPLYEFADLTVRGVNTKMWIGGQAALRYEF